jgi:hypothetical protein
MHLQTLGLIAKQQGTILQGNHQVTTLCNHRGHSDASIKSMDNTKGQCYLCEDGLGPIYTHCCSSKDSRMTYNKIDNISENDKEYKSIEEPSTGICPNCSNLGPLANHCAICKYDGTSNKLLSLVLNSLTSLLNAPSYNPESESDLGKVVSDKCTSNPS